MNLVQHAWLPFQFSDGRTQVLPLSQMANPDIVDFALPRADFQGAAYQFAIGLLQTVLTPEDEEDWAEKYHTPPTENELQMAFDRVAHAFNLTGDGPLFMQDLDPLSDQEAVPITKLLIDATGRNADHFVKLSSGIMSLEIAALALFTLQINAPAGGSGHRVGLRGGGPLTTLILPNAKKSALWQKLWLNIINQEALDDSWKIKKEDLMNGRIFPWLAPTRVSSQAGSEVYQQDVHPLHMFWAMPRRIRLIVCEKAEKCHISGAISPLTVKDYATKKHGANYSGTWIHPLTPYQWNPKKPEEEKLSIKGQPGGINYKNWDILTFSSDHKDLGFRCATVVAHYQKIAREIDVTGKAR